MQANAGSPGSSLLSDALSRQPSLILFSLGLIMRKILASFMLMIGVLFARADSCWTPSTIGFASDNGDIALRIEYGWPGS
jgi:hypothetical protein